MVVIGEEIEELEEIKVTRLVSMTLYKLKFYKLSFNVQWRRHQVLMALPWVFVKLLRDFERRHYANN